MQPKGWTTLRVLLNRYHEGAWEPLLKYLPPEKAEALSQTTTQSRDISPIADAPNGLLRGIHYSWLAPAIANVPEELQPYVLASLSERKRSRILRLVGIPQPPDLRVPERLKPLFLDILYNKSEEKRHSPAIYSGDSVFQPLLAYSKSKLVELIDFLALQDLADELRHVVDKKKLKQLYLILPPQKQRYLKACLHQKERPSLAKMGLDHWDGDRRKLEVILHRRGLTRLSIALSGQPQEMVWHVSRILDTGRGQRLLKNWSGTEVPTMTQVIRKQLTQLMKRFEGPKK